MVPNNLSKLGWDIGPLRNPSSYLPNTAGEMSGGLEGSQSQQLSGRDWKVNYALIGEVGTHN